MAAWGRRAEAKVYLDVLRALMRAELHRMIVLHIGVTRGADGWRPMWVWLDNQCRQKRLQLRSLSHRVGVGLL